MTGAESASTTTPSGGGENPVLALLLEPEFRRATFAGKRRSRTPYPYERVIIRTLELRGEPMAQVSRFDGKKDFSRNVPRAGLEREIADVLAAQFANIHVTTVSEEIDLRLSRKGEWHLGRTKRPQPAEEIESHNRIKNLPLPEDKADRVLQMMGIMTRDNTVRPTMRAKFTQINEFLRVLDSVLPAVGAADDIKRELEILDCGCGSSYLTIAAHHYLNEIKHLPARLLGVDFNEELIRKSTEKTADAHGGSGGGLSFAAGRIGSLDNIHPDIVLALHACDTATDDAIAQAIKSNAKVLLAVPCCHKDLNARLHIPALNPIERHGILHQRFADITTDAFRALVLRIMGFRTDVIEFISPEHTARNLMIRAVRTGADNAEAAREYQQFKSFTQVTPYLETALGDLLTQRLPTPSH
ncbi:MAG TPA: SAM-dependent methyltransferase [Phycisphaerae bacterium]|nr:SAM-dependent methyltransferase [Phycisphaerae bacterium]